jgi:hypothetical protein
MAVTTAPTAPVRLDGATTALIAFTVIAWASAFPAIRAGLVDYGPLELGAARFAVAAIPAAIYLLLTRPKLPARGELWRFAYGGVFFVAAYTLLLNIGELTVTAGAASFIINVAPIIAASPRHDLPPRAPQPARLARHGALLRRHRPDRASARATAWSSISARCSSSPPPSAPPPRHRPETALRPPPPARRFRLEHGHRRPLPRPRPALRARPSAEASPAGLFSALYLGLVPSLLAYGTWTLVLARMPASRAINFMFAVPPTATLMGFALLGEVPTTLGILGGLLALAGVVLVNLRR